MQKLLQQFIQDNKLIASGDRVLVAVSGGVDSVVLCYLFNERSIPFGIGHCNFQLRGLDSDEDALFVEQLAKQFSVPYYTTKFDTAAIAEKEKKSIQLVARRLRYDWFAKILQEENFQAVATAHHLNDSIETFLYNFAKGTGLRGLTGIPIRNQSIIRPLLFASKEQILAYAQAHQIAYRADSSNAEDKYARNKLRHHALPILKQLNPSLEQTSIQTFQNLREAARLYDFAVQQLLADLVERSEAETRIFWPKLLSFPTASSLLHECLRPFGFHPDQVGQILEEVARKTGAFFYSKSHQLLVDRQYLIVRSKGESSEITSYVFEEGQEELILEDGQLEAQWGLKYDGEIHRATHMAQLDINKLSFPLKLRHWKPGDYFCPIGMEGKRQKLQDFFSNHKLTRFEKEKIWLLETAAGEICWLLGYRIDERFKMTFETKEYALFKWTKNN